MEEGHIDHRFGVMMISTALGGIGEEGRKRRGMTGGEEETGGVVVGTTIGGRGRSLAGMSVVLLGEATTVPVEGTMEIVHGED